MSGGERDGDKVLVGRNEVENGGLESVGLDCGLLVGEDWIINNFPTHPLNTLHTNTHPP